MDEWRETLDGMNWLQFESAGATAEKILVFASMVMLNRMAGADVLLMDGMSKVPDKWMQLYTIHAIVDGISIPCVFALLPRKNEQTYKKMFKVIKTACSRYGIRFPEPSTIVVDFELAIMNAIACNFPNNPKINGCYFHLNQCVQRWLNANKLADHYQEENFNMLVKKLVTLAFIPEPDVPSVWEDIKEQCSTAEEKKVAQYFGDTFVNGDQFPPATWNLFDSVWTGALFINNAAESWHRWFQNLIIANQESVYYFLHALKMATAARDTRLVQIQVGQRRLRPKNQQFLRKLKEVLDAYGTITPLQTLEKIAYSIHNMDNVL